MARAGVVARICRTLISPHEPCRAIKHASAMRWTFAGCWDSLLLSDVNSALHFSQAMTLETRTAPHFARSNFLVACWAVGSLMLLTALPLLGADPLVEHTQAFIDDHCASCHDDVEKKAGLDLTSLTFDPNDARNLAHWVKVHDRVLAGEMPPKKKRRPEQEELGAFSQSIASSVIAAERERNAREGRATQRRLNRTEFENAVRDLLHAPWLQVKGFLPEDGTAHRFDKIGEALDVSHVQIARFMAAADYAMREAMSVELLRSEAKVTRYYARDQRSLIRFMNVKYGLDQVSFPDRQTFPALGTKPQPEVRHWKAPLSDPATRELEAVGWTHSHYEGFSTRWGNFRAPVAGRYRIRFNGYTLWAGPGGYQLRFYQPTQRVGTPLPAKWFLPNYDDISPGRRDEPITIYAEGPLMNRRLGTFDITPEPAVYDLGEVWLTADEIIATDVSRFYRSRPVEPNPRNPLAQKDGVPAVAFRWMEIEGPLYDEETVAGYRLLFGNLPLRKRAGAASVTKTRPPQDGDEFRRSIPHVPLPDWEAVEVLSTNPQLDAERLLRRFISRAYRRPPQEAEVQRFLTLIKQQLERGLGFMDAMLAGYTAVLCSPGFLFFEEKPGKLDDYALAARLSFFLLNSEPDAALRAAAACGELHQPDVLRAQTERLLDDRKAERFVEAFTDHWLDLRKIQDSTPSNTLYNDYYLDDMLSDAALAETRLFFYELLLRDLPACNLAHSDFTFLNEHLANHYGVPGVKGIAMRRVQLPADSPRGGLMTQASVLKVTANGTTTSPVLRGYWITERILGIQIPPPPPVAAVDPDIRGAVTIRQQLEKHRADASCSSCHSKMDPPGFALESFDVMGGWRDRYRGVSEDQPPVEGFGKDGHPFAFHHALPVDAQGELPDGRAFTDIREFKRLLLADEAAIARNLARQMVIYATGAPVRFSDREEIERILQEAKSRDYGVRSLVHAIVQSDLFLHK